MKRNDGFTLVEVMFVLVIAGVIGTLYLLNSRGAVDRTRDAVCSQQAVSLQEHLNGWVARQSSLGAAISSFADDGTGTYVPKDLSGLLAQVSQTLQTDNDAFVSEDGKTVVSQALKANSSYITITWTPANGSLRNSYPKANLCP